MFLNVLGINILAGSASKVSQQSLVDMLTRGHNSLIGIFGYVIPNIRFGIAAIVNIDFVQLLIYIILVATISVLFVVLAQFVYFRGAIGVNETSANRKRLKSKDYVKSTVSGNVLITYTMKELKLLFRTPIYFLNCVSTVILLPLILGGSMLTQLGKGSGEISTLIKSIPWGTPQLALYVLAAGAALGWMMSSLNLITPTAISREGQNVYFMKFIPMPYFTQLLAKVFSGLIISMVGILCFLVPIAWFIKLPLNLTLIALVAAILTAVFMNFLGMIADVLHPKLVWEQEASAVKQNLNALFTMIPALGLSFGIFMLIAVLPDAVWVSLFLFLILIGMDVLIVYLTKVIGEKELSRLLG